MWLLYKLVTLYVFLYIAAAITGIFAMMLRASSNNVKNSNHIRKIRLVMIISIILLILIDYNANDNRSMNYHKPS